MIGRADIEGSKSNVAMNAWLPQASPNQGGICPFDLQEISVLFEPPFGHLRYCLTDVPPQPNSPSDNAFGYLKRVIVTPAVYPRLVEFLHGDIQSTGQKSHCVNTAHRPSQCYVLIRQSDSPCPYQF
ncbi:hypothetical protein COEREDRAFT_94980 [Coemansia reversa NRRL 1564]|uniref:Uncharacterized protein n=1 Tax=Coemansia reversa (strain ATCC 12441 / NRRL 1564) TaxID=763665 RepID=A0A2G5B0V3_COERN|nr:hypothetical protein COEREDRAFT_94980 [Coemansia reversa NRRL 1564]|eukprot:PIA12640.1 hypothetical protein COEREDRAFT_94980 [Coemansia reversa NRRL 1564]